MQIGSGAWALPVALLVPITIGGLAGAVTAASVRDWYAAIAKPAWVPPPWLFSPVWTALYLLMGSASWLVWRAGAGRPEAVTALVVYGCQLLLNGAWSVIFFGFHDIGAALVEILLLVLAVLATLLLFWRVSALAGALLLPYLGWCLFATALNYEFWRLNR
ncbi:MAG: tryptophan-rich sensory protein [Fimbriimonadaceae bacterium]|nr:tryptophan-rich sensory protein [Fimbriimonadaceae bacterium]